MYDALLIVSFGGPESPDEVIPFLENVLRGRNVPDERMMEVAEHYQRFGGVSPLNGQNRDLIDALRRELAEQGPRLPIYWGNRNWHPLLSNALQRMADDGIERALGFFTSAFSSYSGCRQYREDIERAQSGVRGKAPRVDKLRVFFNHPGFVETMIDRTRDAISRIPDSRQSTTELIYTAHSIPLAMSRNCRYVQQLEETCRLVSEGLGWTQWQLVFQSRSGPPNQPWLEPDIGDALGELTNTTDVVIVPIGFISDHMEIIFDLDTEAKQKAASRGINVVRAGTAGTHPRFVTMIRELIVERMSDNPDRQRPALGQLGPSHDECPIDCCLSGRPSPPEPSS